VSGLLKGWAQVPVGKFAAKTKNVDPSKSPAEVFELYSVPSFSTGSPEVVPGSEIKSSKQVVLPGDVLLCKIVPHINRVWTVKTQEQRRQIASGEWIVYRNHGCEPHYLRYCLSEESFRGRFLSTVAGVGGSLMRARPSEVAKIEVLIPPLPEQRRIVAKLDSVTGHTARAQEQLGRIPRLIKKYREAILAAVFSGELTREWRQTHVPKRVDDDIGSMIRRERDAQQVKAGIRPKGKNRSITGRAVTLPAIPLQWAWVTFDDCAWDLTVGHVGPMKDRYVASGIPFCAL
jgi:type I restriction enzyme, S subunit